MTNNRGRKYNVQEEPSSSSPNGATIGRQRANLDRIAILLRPQYEQVIPSHLVEAAQKATNPLTTHR
jgi:hypothetical protein